LDDQDEEEEMRDEVKIPSDLEDEEDDYGEEKGLVDEEDEFD
jgi:hypothetical protein